MMKMQVKYEWNNKSWNIDLSKGKDISIPLIPGKTTPNCFYAPFFDARPVRSGDFIGSIKEGGPVNFKNLIINPHGNGTHTECVGHILDGPYTINKSLQKFHFTGELISVFPTLMPNGDRVITEESLQLLGLVYPVELLIIRTLPNPPEKPNFTYSGNNPAYFEPEAIQLINDWGVKHLITDLPSVDREVDEGKLTAHHTFWNTNASPSEEKTITELVFVPDDIKDGLYMVNIHIISLETDASPSKIVLYDMYNA
jgi:kynurenine formamidase